MPYCPDCRNEKPAEQFPMNRSTRSGLEPEDVEWMILDQGGVCAVCRERPPTQVDHDHRTGVVRGILCDGSGTSVTIPISSAGRAST